MERARVSRFVGVVGLLAGFALLGMAEFAPAARNVVHALTNCDVGSHQEIDAEEQAFLQLINQYRQQNGKGQLTLSTNLNRASAWMAEDMATKGYFSHTDSLGRNASGRAQDCGYPGGAGENIAAGTSWDTAQEVFDAWKNSSGHNANMLNSSYVKIGIARYFNANSTYRWYWVTDFGLVDDGGSSSNTPTATATRTPTRTPTPAPPASTPAPATATNTPPQPTSTNTLGPSTPTNTSAPPAPTRTPTSPPPTPTSPPPTPTRTPTASGDSPPLVLANGANLVTWTGPSTSPSLALQKQGSEKVLIIYSYNAASGTWSRYGKVLPGYANNLTVLMSGQAYWFITTGSTSLVVK
jgi:uncharacterized protein YkwD